MYLKPSAAFDPLQNGAILAPYAALAYDINAPKKIKSWELVERFSWRGAEGFLAFRHDIQDKPCIIVAIAGTDDWLDVRHDLRVQATTLAQGPAVHCGFAAHAVDCRVALKNWRDLIARPDATVWITGHSLGGAAAVLLPLFLEVPAARIYTYGSPPAIAQGSGGTYVRSVTRFAHIMDVVPKVYRSLYEHVGRPFWIRSSGKVTGSPSAIHWAAEGLAKVGRILTRGFLAANKHYHSMAQYQRLLESYA